jgi:hypothetical protein
MSQYPHFDRWLDEKKEEIRQAARDYPPLPLSIINNPPHEGENNHIQEANVSELNPQPTQESEGPKCEYCGTPLKEAKQARAIHLRYCKAYKAAKANGHGPAIAGDDIPLTPEQASRLWSAITGGTLVASLEDNKIVCRVSKSSFDKALPVLLDLL